jgi:two-component system, response regulator
VTEAPIVLIEDNPDDAELTRRAFAKNGFPNEVVVLDDGEKCLAVLLPDDGGPAPTPALILLDINLPKVDGLQVLRRLRADERTRHLAIVMLTTSTEERDLVASYRLGANGFVRKPLSFVRFESVVATLGAYWLQINEPCPPARDRQRP